MKNFEQYWEENKEAYMAKAKEDFEQSQAKYTAYVQIDSDDDFRLDIDHIFQKCGQTYEEVADKIIDYIMSAKFDYVKTYCIRTWDKTNSHQIENKGDYAHTWHEIRDAAIQQLKQGEMYVTLGGNQTITIEVQEYEPVIAKKKKI
jgi:hypothetical protein